MNSQRKFLLIALIVALLAGVSVGWMWGDDMKAAINAKKTFQDARQSYRRVVYNEGLSALTKELTNAESALRTLKAGPNTPTPMISEPRRAGCAPADGGSKRLRVR